LFLCARFRFRLRDLNADGPENPEIAGLAPERRQLGVDGGAMLFHAGERAPGAELHVRVFGGEIHSRSRLSRLDDDRPLLRGRQGGKRAAYVEVFSAKVEPMHLVRIDENATLAVEHERIALDAVPEQARHLQVLLRAPVALVMIHQLVEAPIRRLALVGRRHRVPGDAAAGQVVERVEHPRDVERMMIGRRHRQREADAGRGARQQRDHRRHVVPRPFCAKSDDSAMIATIVLRGAAIVAEKQQVHHSARGDARDLLVEVGRAVIRIADPGARYPPEVVGM
jgi:hypothetical protein